MAIDCDNIPCTKVLPTSSVISIFGSTETTVNTQCCTNVLYLIDEAGLTNQAVATSDPWLTTDSRTQQVSSAVDVKTHFSPCSRTYKALTKFFTWPEGELKRPSSITVGYFDSEAGETMVEAVTAIFECSSCFYVMGHIAYDKAGTALYDTADQIALGAWGTANEVLTVLPTIDENILLTTDATSNAHASKLAGDEYATYQLLNEECENTLDATTCLPTGETTNTYGYQDLLLAAVVGSADCDADSYEFNVKFKPQGGSCTLGVSTAVLNQTEVIYATGSNPLAEGVQPSWPHHVNVYHNVGGYCMFMEGLTATGNYIDEMIHKRYIKDKLNSLLMTHLVDSKNVSMANLTSIRGQVTGAIIGFVGKGVITDVANAVDVTKFNNVIASGNGWVLSQSNVTQANLTSRVTPAFTFCYVRPSSINYISIGLCQSNIEVGVV